MKLQVTRKILPLGGKVAFFKMEGLDGVDVTNMPAICLSRVKPGKCNFALSQLDEHDWHAPPYTDDEGLNAYIDRVKTDIIEALKAGGYEVEVEKTDAPAPVEEEESEEEDNN